MRFEYYLHQFRKAVDRLPESRLNSLQLEVFTGIVLNSAAFKLYDRSWASDPANPVNSPGRIFFSIWINDNSISKSRVYYNIHALKIRLLKNYNLTARVFADQFRLKFKEQESKWSNVRVDYGPLTLMEGWYEYSDESLEDTVVVLSESFFEIKAIIDEILSSHRKK